MRISLTTVLVADQDTALGFYTEKLGFVKRVDIPMGEFRWLTVVSPEDPEGTQLVLEPNANPVAATYQHALYESGIPLTSFEVPDVKEEFERLRSNGVEFHTPPTEAGDTTIAVFEDTCGNLIQIHEAA